MAQAQIALEKPRTPAVPLDGLATTWATLRARRHQRRELARMLAQRGPGRATGARV